MLQSLIQSLMLAGSYLSAKSLIIKILLFSLLFITQTSETFASLSLSLGAKLMVEKKSRFLHFWSSSEANGVFCQYFFGLFQ